MAAAFAKRKLGLDMVIGSVLMTGMVGQGPLVTPGMRAPTGAAATLRGALSTGWRDWGDTVLGATGVVAAAFVLMVSTPWDVRRANSSAVSISVCGVGAVAGTAGSGELRIYARRYGRKSIRLLKWRLMYPLRRVNIDDR